MLQFAGLSDRLAHKCHVSHSLPSLALTAASLAQKADKLVTEQLAAKAAKSAIKQKTLLSVHTPTPAAVSVPALDEEFWLDDDLLPSLPSASVSQVHPPLILFTAESWFMSHAQTLSHSSSC